MSFNLIKDSWNNLKSIWNLFSGNSANGDSFYTGGLSTNATAAEGIANSLTGNLDYQRQIEAQVNSQQYNSAEAQKARDWQLYMSNTAYQRQAADLEAAGYNPALVLGSGGASAYSASSGASSGIGNTGETKALQVMTSILGLLANTAYKNAQAEFLENKKELINSQVSRNAAYSNVQSNYANLADARASYYNQIVNSMRANTYYRTKAGDFENHKRSPYMQDLYDKVFGKHNK
ncbi:minor capsid protein [Capybara microvirus Cap3_SP_478]|nr:minor capsid protein [Capybara microvirus Cap3_SP_478]